MKHKLTERDVKDAAPYLLDVIMKQLGLLRTKGATDTEVKHGLLLKHLGSEVELHQPQPRWVERVPGCKVANLFSLLDWRGSVVGTCRVEGVFVGVWNGYVHIEYRTAELPARFKAADVLEEFTTVRHECDPDEWL